MVPPKFPMPPPLPSLDYLSDEGLEDIDPNGHESVKSILARLVDSNNHQSKAILAQNRVLREIGEQIAETWKLSRDAHQRSQNNERNILQESKRLTQLKEDAAKTGMNVQRTGSFQLDDIQQEMAQRQMVDEYRRNKSSWRRLKYSLWEKMLFAGILLAAILMGAGCTVVIYEIMKKGPSIPSLPGGP